MDDIWLTVASWSRFVVRDLAVTPDVVGLAHEFIYDGHRVTIELPSRSAIPSEALEGDILSFNVRREIDGKQVPVFLWVRAVDVVVRVPQPVSAPAGILDTPPNAYEIVSAIKRAELDSMTSAYETLATKAFDFWIQILRWKSDNAEIGRPEVIGHKSGWGTYLFVAATAQRIWASPHVVEMRVGKLITAEVWKRVESAVQQGLRPPVFFELLFDAMEHMKLADIRRAIVDLAVACETFLRKIVATHLPPGLGAAIRQHIDDANIRSVLTKFIPELLDEREQQQLRKLQSRLHSLFDCRNEIVHLGRVPQSAAGDCKAYIEATRQLFQIKDLEKEEPLRSAG